MIGGDGVIINIVSGSPSLEISLIDEYPSDLTIGVDFGAYRLIKDNKIVDIAFGDFDSISTDQFVKILNSCAQVLKFNAEKDKTDTELALSHAITLHPSIINLFGATGRRIDHFLSVINLFSLSLEHNILLNIVDSFNKIYVLKPGHHIIEKTKFKYISFFGYNGCVSNLTLKGLKYELTNYLLTNSDSLCVSNEFNDANAEISFTEGNLLIVESSD